MFGPRYGVVSELGNRVAMVTCSASDSWLLCPPLSSAGTRRHRGSRSLSTLATRANRARLDRAGSSWRSKPRANGIIAYATAAPVAAVRLRTNPPSRDAQCDLPSQGRAEALLEEDVGRGYTNTLRSRGPRRHAQVSLENRMRPRLCATLASWAEHVPANGMFGAAEAQLR